MLIFIAVAKFNYTIFTPGYFYLVIHQIKLNQSEHDLASFKNVCANVTKVWFMSTWGNSCGVLTHYCPTAVCSVHPLEITTPSSMLWSSWFACWCIGTNSPRLMGRSVKHKLLHKLCCFQRNAKRTRFSEPRIAVCTFHVLSSPELEKSRA